MGFSNCIHSNYASAFGYYGERVDNEPKPRQKRFEEKGFFDYGFTSGNVQHICGYVPGLAFLTGLVCIILAGIQLYNGKDLDGRKLKPESKANLWSEVGRGTLEMLQFSLILLVVDIIFTWGRVSDLLNESSDSETEGV